MQAEDGVSNSWVKNEGGGFVLRLITGDLARRGEYPERDSTWYMVQVWLLPRWILWGLEIKEGIGI